uniref:Uncharacterized protein n=1 Tax=Desertifilum tharense IPPAS B-1220 TaxID=1781255 RepID=A0ACD5GX97_9CYAN
MNSALFSHSELGTRNSELTQHSLLTRNSELGTLFSPPSSPLSTQHFTLSTHFPPSPHPPTLFPTQHSALYTQHYFPHSALSTLHSALFPPLSTQHFTLSTHFPHSALSTFYSALLPRTPDEGK